MALISGQPQWNGTRNVQLILNPYHHHHYYCHSSSLGWCTMIHCINKIRNVKDESWLSTWITKRSKFNFSAKEHLVMATDNAYTGTSPGRWQPIFRSDWDVTYQNCSQWCKLDKAYQMQENSFRQYYSTERNNRQISSRPISTHCLRILGLLSSSAYICPPWGRREHS